MATKTLNVRMQQLYRPNTEWSGKTLLSGELGIDNSYNAVKIGDGMSLFEALPAYGWIPPGTIIVSGVKGGDTPLGYLNCDGKAVSRSYYASLFKAINTGYGSGDGSTTFNVPDFRDRFIKCVGSFLFYGRMSGGSSSVVLTESQIPSHTHRIEINIQHGDGASVTAESLQTGLQQGGRRRYFDTSGSTGGGAAHDNMPKYLEAKVFIKY